MQVVKALSAAASMHVVLTDHECAATFGFPCASFQAVIVLSPSHAADSNAGLIAALLACKSSTAVHLVLSHVGHLPQSGSGPAKAARRMPSGTKEAHLLGKHQRSDTKAGGSTLPQVTSQDNRDLLLLNVPDAQGSKAADQALPRTHGAPQLHPDAPLQRTAGSFAVRPADDTADPAAELQAAMCGEAALDNTTAHVVVLSNAATSYAQRCRPLMSSLVKVRSTLRTAQMLISNNGVCLHCMLMLCSILRSILMSTATSQSGHN
jgi:hypothetical protein